MTDILVFVLIVVIIGFAAYSLTHNEPTDGGTTNTGDGNPPVVDPATPEQPTAAV